MIVGVVGLGKIGLPLAVQCATRGFDVVGIDIDEHVVQLVNEGQAPFPGEPGLGERLHMVVASGALRATSRFDDGIPACSVVIIAVPLVVDAINSADFRAIDAATDAVGVSVRAGCLVAYETTLPVGSTRDRFAPALASRSGLELGTDLLVCHSPERVSSGSVFRDLRQYPKLVGGIDAASAARAVTFYEAAVDFEERPDLDRPNGVWDLGSSEAAELAKLAETTYRDVNIGFANELAIAAEQVGVDVLSVIAACNSQPYSHIHTPGISVGGHCIPVYPHLLMQSINGFVLPAAARGVNAAMPLHAVRRVEQAMHGGLRGARVAVLGLAYRAGVKEDAYSGAHAIVEALRARGASALVHDPLFSDDELSARGYVAYRFGEPCDAAILHTEHPDYRDISAADLPGVAVVYDGRNALDPSRFLGVDLIPLGRGAR